MRTEPEIYPSAQLDGRDTFSIDEHGILLVRNDYPLLDCVHRPRLQGLSPFSFPFGFRLQFYFDQRIGHRAKNK